MQYLQLYRQPEPVYDNNAYAIGLIYYNGQLKMFITYLTQPISPGSHPEYYTYQLNIWGMTGNVEFYR